MVGCQKVHSALMVCGTCVWLPVMTQRKCVAWGKKSAVPSPQPHSATSGLIGSNLQL